MTTHDKLQIAIDNAVPDIRQRLRPLYELAVSIKAELIIELGVRSGDSTRALLCACEQTGGIVSSFDIDGDAYRVPEVTEKMGIPWEWHRTWSCQKSDSAKAAEGVEAGIIDLVFVDTDHSLETTRREIKAWAPCVRPGGCMAFHDTELNEPGRDGVRPACEDWANANPNWEWQIYPHLEGGDTGFGVLWRRV